MEAHERQEILALLEQGRAALPAAVEGVTDELARRIPGEGRWSILGCAEHIAVSEDYMFAQMGIATTPETPVINREREAKMLARGTDRSRRMESPPEGHPTGAFPTLGAAIAQFIESRDRTIAFVRDCQEDLRAKVTWHPILKEANCHEMLLSIGLHALRHVKQIEEIKAELA
ncbi:MAG TPA: DinB family protein [Terracidiphilus sp.]|nr:DinB family protein [Terracidiphilus sp.]